MCNEDKIKELEQKIEILENSNKIFQKLADEMPLKINDIWEKVIEDIINLDFMDKLSKKEKRAIIETMYDIHKCEVMNNIKGE